MSEEASVVIQDSKSKSVSAQNAGVSIDSLPSLETSTRDEGLNAMQIITQKAIALHLKALGIDFTHSALDYFLDLVNLHLHNTLWDLQKIVQTQRRLKVSPKDVRLLLRDYHLSTGELEEELTKSQEFDKDIIEKKKQLEKQALEAAENMRSTHSEYIPDSSNTSFVFFAHDEDIIRLIPPTNRKNSAVPSWMPEFPPDHTYRKTPKFIDRITDQKLVRAKIVEESQLGERALDNLIANSKLKKDLDQELMEESDIPIDYGKVESLEEHPVPKADNNKEEKYNIWTSNPDKRFDIELYARARFEFLRKKEEKKKKALNKLDKEYILIVKQLSMYTDNESADEDKIEVSPEQYLEKQYKKTLNTFKSLKQKKASRELERQKLQEEENRRREELKKMQPQTEGDADFQTFDDFENFEKFGEGDDNVFNFDGAEGSKVNGQTVIQNGDGNESGSNDVEMVDEADLISAVDNNEQSEAPELSSQVPSSIMDPVLEEQDLNGNNGSELEQQKGQSEANEEEEEDVSDEDEDLFENVA